MKKKKKSNRPGPHPSPDFEVLQALDEVHQVMLEDRDDRLLWHFRKTLGNALFIILLMLAFISLLLLLFLTLWIGHFLSWIAGIIIGIVGLLILFLIMISSTPILLNYVLEVEEESNEDFADQ